VEKIDWNEATIFPGVLVKNNTHSAGGRTIQFHAPEIADHITKILCGTENKLNYMIAVLPLDAIEKRAKSKPGPKPKE